MEDWKLELENELYEKFVNDDLDDDDIWEMKYSFEVYDEVVDDYRRWFIDKFTVCKIKDIYIGIEWSKAKNECDDNEIDDWYEVIPKEIKKIEYVKKEK